MSRREAWISAVVVFAVALAVRIAAAAAISFPVPENTAYYVGVARSLVEGRGLISDALWSFQTQPLVVPRAAFEVWLPLPSLLAALPMAVTGAAEWLRAAQAVSVLAGSAVAVMAWRIAADVAVEMDLPAGRARTLAVGTGLVAAGLGPLVMYSVLPDSTELFAALALAACLLMTRISSKPGRDRRLVVLGAVIGLAALTRSEAVWLGLAWAIVGWFWTPGTRRERILLIAVPAAVALAVYSPWAVRDWLVFGNPLPGQAISNALYLHDYDIFAYRDPPTIARFLGQGPVGLAGTYLRGLGNDLVLVLALPAFPVGLVGLMVLPWTCRHRALRPLVVVSLVTFLATSLMFPVATLSGTFLHSAGAVFALLALSCLLAFDGLIVRIGRIRHWTKPVAWIGPGLAIAAILPLMFVTVQTVARQSNDTRDRYAALPAALALAGVPLTGPVITDHPIWLAEATRVTAIALPQESPESVLALANRFGAKLLIVDSKGEHRWPAILEQGGIASQCFREVNFADNSPGMVKGSSPSSEFRVFRIACP